MQDALFEKPTKDFESEFKRCKVIYSPKGQAEEYSKFALNPYRGCGHACIYCYVPSVVKVDRKEFDSSAVERKDFLSKLSADCEILSQFEINDQVLLCFSTDPYHPFDNTLTRKSLQLLRNANVPFCTLTKGGTRSLRDLDLFRPEKDSFASTMTSVDPAFSKKWERGAALPEDRIEALKKYHDAGIFTWISLEPVISVEATMDVIKATYSFIDLFKVGRINYSEITRNTNWEEFTHIVIDLLQSLKANHYVKKDLQGFLPTGYQNNMRPVQHK
jgi:DNA repair photolyase